MARRSPVRSPGREGAVKAVKAEDVPPPQVTFFQPHVGQVLVLFSLFSGGESTLKRFLPKSHLSKVIIRDNTSVQRVQEIKLRHIEDSKRKVGSLCDQMKKKFVHDQQKKMTRWKNQYSRYQRMLEQIDQRAMLKAGTSSSALVEPQKSKSFLGWRYINPKQGRLRCLPAVCGYPYSSLQSRHHQN
ncbi:uncharacterized protein C5orf52 homolog isoform X2 [Rhineura floridana]|uniref:uncharacterized protein C5orf52 homolog isoform X2 n=2 Tax=Rhineura floridana TaxID=261503 RepID=UPI002AC85C8D|nr:uncharacterized protein C5orf52 homolog isoform X2 [Rhineura floridana]